MLNNDSYDDDDWVSVMFWYCMLLRLFTTQCHWKMPPRQPLSVGPSVILLPLSVWPHLFRGAGHEKWRGEQLKWSLTFSLYIGSFPCAQLPGPFHTARLGRVCFCVFSLGLYFVYWYIDATCWDTEDGWRPSGSINMIWIHLCFFDLFVCSHPLCFPGQLSNLPYSFWHGMV